MSPGPSVRQRLVLARDAADEAQGYLGLGEQRMGAQRAREALQQLAAAVEVLGKEA